MYVASFNDIYMNVEILFQQLAKFKIVRILAFGIPCSIEKMINLFLLSFVKYTN